MKKLIRLFLILISVCFLFTGSIYSANADNEKIYLGGMPAGFSLYQRGAFVVGLCDVFTDSGIVSPSKDAGVLKGDTILYIDNKETNNAKDIENYISDGNEKTLNVKRNGEIIEVKIKPAKDFNGKFKLGVFIRDVVNGIGTITYIKGDKFASLGHPVLDENGKLLDITGGNLYSCSITDVKKGERGTPGELHGVFIDKNPIGDIKSNLYCGVFGNINNNFDKSNLKEISLGVGKVGDAFIYSTLSGEEPTQYSISIIKADFDRKENKNFVVKINDERLLEFSGGIVQGMSGSPIIQDGKLIGAITHVFINDPTRGFGISIDNMIKNQ